MELPMMRRRVAQARVARLATVGPAGRPHLVPVCFAADGDRIVTAIDSKPKTTTALKRLDNIRANPAVSLLVDHFEEDWSQLWWVRVDGQARVLDDDPESRAFIAPLLEKYRGQYGLHPPAGSVVVIDADHWAGWAASPSA